LQALALNQGMQQKWKLWTERGRKQLEALPLLPWASRRRAELLRLHDELEASIEDLNQAVFQQANTRPGAQRLMTHPGVGAATCPVPDSPAYAAANAALQPVVEPFASEMPKNQTQNQG
jgi:hypothetical protein